MSTKASIYYGDDFHFYNECMDSAHVYLELRGNEAEYEVYPGSVMVRIPAHIWEAIRGYAFNTEFAYLTDEALLEKARDKAKSNIAWKRNHPGMEDFATFWGYDEPEDVQAERLLSEYKALREQHKDLLDRANSIKERMGR